MVVVADEPAPDPISRTLVGVFAGVGPVRAVVDDVVDLEVNTQQAHLTQGRIESLSLGHVLAIDFSSVGMGDPTEAKPQVDSRLHRQFDSGRKDQLD